MDSEDCRFEGACLSSGHCILVCSKTANTEIGDDLFCQAVFSLLAHQHLRHSELEAVQWAKRKQGAPAGRRCASCVKLVSRAFCGLEWEAVQLKCRTDATFKKIFDSSLKVLEGSKSKDFGPEEFDEEACLTLKMQRYYWFLSESEFTKEFGCLPSECPGAVMESMRTETGAMMKGVLITHPEKPYREVVAETTASTCMRHKLMPEKDHVRAGQGQGYGKLV